MMSNDPKNTSVDWSNSKDYQDQSSQSSSGNNQFIVSLNESGGINGLDRNIVSSNSLIGNETFNKKDNNKK